jgi:hypothetical protein
MFRNIGSVCYPWLLLQVIGGCVNQTTVPAGVDDSAPAASETGLDSQTESELSRAMDRSYDRLQRISLRMRASMAVCTGPGNYFKWVTKGFEIGYMSCGAAPFNFATGMELATRDLPEDDPFRQQILRLKIESIRKIQSDSNTSKMIRNFMGDVKNGCQEDFMAGVVDAVREGALECKLDAASVGLRDRCVKGFLSVFKPEFRESKRQLAEQACDDEHARFSEELRAHGFSN